MARFNDLKARIVRNGLRQYEVAEYLDYHPTDFSSVLAGRVPPKGGQTPQEFREAVRAAIKQLQGSKT